jgi:hypothetical protein
MDTGSKTFKKRWFTAAAFVSIALAIGFTMWNSAHSSDSAECYACSRRIHAHTRTVAFLKGHSRVFCCPACALSEHQQENTPVRITQLTSFLTGRPISPNGAYLVRGSNVNMCTTTQAIINADKRDAGMVYDRCAPSLIAFASRAEAADFARAHGGTVMPFQEAASALAR